MNLEDRLENLKTVDIDLPHHRESLRRSLLTSDLFNKKHSPSFLKRFMPLIAMSLTIAVIFTTGIFIGINIGTNQDSKTLVFDSLNDLIVQANEKADEELDEKKNFYYLLAKVTEQSEAPYKYSLTYFDETWINTRNLDEWRKILTEDNKLIEETKDIDGKTYECTSCEGLFSYKYNLYEDQDPKEGYKSFDSIFYDLEDAKKIDYNSSIDSLFGRIASPQVKKERLKFLEELNGYDEIEFDNEYEWNGEKTYGVIYSWEAENLKSNQILIFDLETLDWIGYESEKFVGDILDERIKIEVSKEEFRDEAFDTSTEGLKLKYDSSKRGVGGQLDIYTEDVKMKTSFYDDYYDSYEEYLAAWIRFRDSKVDISMKIPDAWNLRLEERTDYKGVYEYRVSTQGLYLRVEETNASKEKSLNMEKLETIKINDQLSVDLYLEKIHEDDPNNYYDIKDFEALIIRFSRNDKTYIVSKLINPGDDKQKTIQVFKDIIKSIEFEG